MSHEDPIENSPNESERIAQAKSFDELYEILEGIGDIQGSKKLYSFGDIIELIHDARDELKKYQYPSVVFSMLRPITNTFGLRNKVRELLLEENPAVKEKKGLDEANFEEEMMRRGAQEKIYARKLEENPTYFENDAISISDFTADQQERFNAIAQEKYNQSQLQDLESLDEEAAKISENEMNFIYSLQDEPELLFEQESVILKTKADLGYDISFEKYCLERAWENIKKMVEDLKRE
jgi:hypothetical protein